MKRLQSTKWHIKLSVSNCIFKNDMLVLYECVQRSATCADGDEEMYFLAFNSVFFFSPFARDSRVTFCSGIAKRVH